MLFCFEIIAQDVQYSNILLTPLYLNPANTGLTNKHRAGLSYRNQWPGISKTYSTYMASYDYNADLYNSGFGGFILQDRTGTTGLVNTYGSFNYSYKIETAYKQEARAGLILGFGQKRIDNSQLIFNDQLITGNSSVENVSNINSKTYADVGFGFLYHTSKLDGGFTIKHLNRPDVSMTGSKEAMKMLFSLHGNYRIILAGEDKINENHEQVLTLIMQYRNQQNNNQLELGVNYLNKMLNFGLMYRGLPLKDFKTGYERNECLAFTAGLTVPGKGLKFSYTYDFTVSKLEFSNSKGAHEITCIYEFGKDKADEDREQKIKKVKNKKKTKGTIKQKF